MQRERCLASPRGPTSTICERLSARPPSWLTPTGLAAAVGVIACRSWGWAAIVEQQEQANAQAKQSAIEELRAEWGQDYLTNTQGLSSMLNHLGSDAQEAILSARTADGVVHLSHGLKGPIGAVSVTTWGDLPGRMAALESIIRNAGYPLRDADLPNTILTGASKALDRYSRVLAGEKLEDFDTQLSGTLDAATESEAQRIVTDLEAFSRFSIGTLLNLPNVKDVHTSFSLGEVKAGAALPLQHLGGA